ncbi:MAG: type II toxin-antitoxin system Phd/YefM family antitoxin [Planctomycetia bacterium]|nr:type II toxin-antitoxin system Phd/YefM family antitoxin [Planctomycetia bacterium]
MVQVGIAEIRDNLADALNKVAYAGERVVLARRGKGIAALVSMEDLALLEKMEDESDVRDAKRALADMKRTGQKGTPLAVIKKRLGMK